MEEDISFRGYGINSSHGSPASSQLWSMEPLGTILFITCHYADRMLPLSLTKYRAEYYCTSYCCVDYNFGVVFSSATFTTLVDKLGTKTYPHREGTYNFPVFPPLNNNGSARGASSSPPSTMWNFRLIDPSASPCASSRIAAGYSRA